MSEHVPAIGEALAALERQQRRAERTLTLIPSENSVSALARLPFMTDAYHRYFFNESRDPQAWAFGAGREASWVETELTLPLLSQLTGASLINVRPLSGLHAMTLVLAALGGPPGTPVVTVHPDQGGHYATADLARRLGLRPLMVTGPDPHTLDVAALTDIVARHRPHLVYLDQGHVLFPIDVAAVATAVHAASPGTWVHADTSHLMGLILGGALPNPLSAGADSFGGSTHKSFPGPQKAFLATNDPAVAKQVKIMQPTLISNHHLAATCSLGLAVAEFLVCDGGGYARTVITAAQILGRALADHGLTPQAADRGFTTCHQLWVRTTPAGIGAAIAANRLEAAGIAVNVLTDLPGLHGEPALRLGTAEAVWQGLTPDDMAEVAKLITDAVFARRPAGQIAERVAELRAHRVSPYRLPAATPDAELTFRLVTSALASLEKSPGIERVAVP